MNSEHEFQRSLHDFKSVLHLPDIWNTYKKNMSKSLAHLMRREVNNLQNWLTSLLLVDST